MKAAVSATEAAEVSQRVGALSRVAFQQSWPARSLFNVAVALACATWVGWWALAWLAAVTLAHAVVFPALEQRLAASVTSAAAKHAGRAILRGLSASLFCVIWSAAWAVGGAEAGFLAGMLLGCAYLSGLVYFSDSRGMFIGATAPPTIISLALQAIYQPANLVASMAVAALLITILRVVWAQRDQVALFTALDGHVEARKAAEEANIAKSQFLATMSHELRTPLNAVIGYAEILEEDLGAEGRKEAAADAGRIRRAARDLLGLINEVLDLSKIEAGRMEVVSERVNLPDIVADVVETTDHIAKANNNAVSVSITDRAGAMLLDPGKVRQCLLNLVSNACKFTNDGKIDIAVTIDGRDGDAILQIVVSDTGIGVAPDQAARLFTPFVQADASHTRKHGGTGLGLVITRRLAQLMGGDVTMRSAIGEGSQFTLVLPARWPSADVAAEANISGRGPLVLVIENEASAIDLYRRALARMPLRVVCVTTAGEGMRIARHEAPALIVLDIYLPDRLGWDVLTEIKGDPRLADVPVMVVSIDDNRPRALSLGACDHLVKPVDRDRLAASVLRFARFAAPAAAPVEKIEAA